MLSPVKVLVVGNSGSGKTTYASALAARRGLAHLDLDAIVWEPGQIAVPRAPEVIRRDLLAFVGGPRWVVEGCYGELVAAALPHCTRLVFLNPGLDVCLAHNQRRPWEPHKYASMAEQDSRLPALQAWVAGYYTRDDPWSYAYHRRLFDGFGGDKLELTAPAPEA